MASVSIACSTTVVSDLPLDAGLGKIAEMGFEHVDMLAMDGWAHISPQNLADRCDEALTQIDEVFARHGLDLVALNASPSTAIDVRDPSTNARRMAETRGLIHLMRHRKIRTASLQPKCAVKNLPWEATLSAAVDTFREQTEMAAAAGVVFGVELHQGSKFETMEQARQLLDAVPALAVVYDPSHPVMQGVDIREHAWLFERTAHVHLRDADLNRMCVEFGKGLVDFEWILKTLRNRNYHGHISIEYLINDDYDVFDSTRRLFDLVKRHFG